jgi:hypothetical protein
VATKKKRIGEISAISRPRAENQYAKNQANRNPEFEQPRNKNQDTTFGNSVQEPNKLTGCNAKLQSRWRAGDQPQKNT